MIRCAFLLGRARDVFKIVKTRLEKLSSFIRVFLFLFSRAINVLPIFRDSKGGLEPLAVGTSEVVRGNVLGTSKKQLKSLPDFIKLSCEGFGMKKILCKS